MGWNLIPEPKKLFRNQKQRSFLEATGIERSFS